MTAPTAPSVRRLRSTARVMLPFPEPESWLDVETGDADFPEAARSYFPYTAFDGVDRTSRVLYAQAVERLEEGHVGRLTDPHITARLRARYDVVSLLNRPADPDELQAALAVLRPGGHLLVESPDDPRAELESQGCTIIATARRSAHVPPRATTRLPRTLLPTARALDHALALLLAGTPFASTYRVIARKDTETWSRGVRGEEVRSREACGAEACGAEVRGGEASGAEGCGAEARGAEGCGAEGCGAEVRGAEARGAEARGAEVRGAEVRRAEARGAEVRGAKARSTETRGAEVPSAVARRAESPDL
ncbi:methyltransferase domain-containing protein [Streptomyces sp. NPDC048420]|uniref:methyltransferase domain-containing protein n=1 Tax=Streptomyces sp. NPDC048420 TaxID=3155755 RepID=UPI00343EF9FC